jgi:hypothetical protein
MNKRRFILYCLGIALWVGASVFFAGSESITKGILPIGSAFAGMLALNGFMFTARTFIVFKLNDTVYSNENYRKEVEEFKKQGAYGLELYEPLKNLDSVIGRASLMCFVTLICLTLFALIPRLFTDYGSLWQVVNQSRLGVEHTCYFVFQLITWVIYSSVVIAILSACYALLRVNFNIKEILKKWESDYKPKI